MRTSTFFLAIMLFGLFPVLNQVEAQIHVDPYGFSVFTEPEDTLEVPITLHNAGEDAVNFEARLLSRLHIPDNMLHPPRRDDPGDLIRELELAHPGALGIARDFENDWMWVTHTIIDPNTGQPVEGTFTAYRDLGDELEVVEEIQPDGIPLGGTYHDGVLYATEWQNTYFIRYDLEGNNLGNIEIEGYAMAFAVDPERELLFCIIFGRPGENPAQIDLLIYDINDDFNLIGQVDNLLNGEDFVDFRSRIYWAPEHEDGNLWLSWRPDANDENMYAWQVNVYEGEDGWVGEEVQHFPVPTDVRSFGIGHDGTDLWVGRMNEASVAIVDDGIYEPNWFVLDPLEGEIAAGEELELTATITPGELDPGFYDMRLHLGFGDENVLPIEMSVIMCHEMQNTMLSGTVRNAADNTLMEDVHIDLDPYLMERTTDNEGAFRIDHLPAGQYQITFSKEDFLPHIEEFELNEDIQELELEIDMLHSSLDLDIEQVNEQLGVGESINMEIHAENNGNGDLDYHITRHIAEGADFDPWTLRGSYFVGQAVDDNRIESLAFVEDMVVVGAENDDDPVYHFFDREGEHLRNIQQPGEEDRSMRGLTWDGQLFWAANSENVFGFNIDGDVLESFDSPFRSSPSMTWDPDREVIWAATTTGEMEAYTREGEYVTTIVTEMEEVDLRIYGLAYYAEDPDGCPIYIFNYDDGEPSIIKCNPDADDGDRFRFVRFLESEHGGRPIGLCITNEYDIYSWVLMTLNNTSDNDGGDRVDVWQLDVKKDWFLIEPTEGQIPAGEAFDFTLTLDASGLQPAEYSGFIRFHHNGIGYLTEVPVTLIVGDGGGPRLEERVMHLEMGWNMISTNVQPQPDDIRELLSDLVEDDLLVLIKDGMGRFYNPEFNFNNIPHWAVTDGYLINVREDVDFTVEGEPVDPDQPLPLLEGWQMISYYPRDPVDARVALSAVEDDLIMAKDGEGRFYNVEWGFSNMGDMNEGFGYLIKMDADAELVYTVPERINSEANLQVEMSSLIKNTGRNMSLLVVSESDIPFDLEVFAGGNLVGTGTIQKGMNGIAVWGDDLTTPEIDGALEYENLEFRVNTQTDEPPSVKFIEGNEIYVSDSFAAIQISTESLLPDEFKIHNCYPNPFNNSVTLEYSLPQKGNVAVAVYNMNGRMVANEIERAKTVGYHKFTWEATTQPSGLYLIELTDGNSFDRTKVILVK